MRARNYASADEWAARLDSLMQSVLRAPDRYPPATLVWARFRRRWLEENETQFCFHGEGTKNLYGVSPETAARLKFSRRPRCLNAAAREEVQHEKT